MDLALDRCQQAVVEHDAGPLRVMGGFGSGLSSALRARADRLRRQGRRPLLLHHGDVSDFAAGILRRHGRPVRLTHDHRAVLRPFVAPEMVDEVSAALLGFQSSFLGAEELRVHADAAGCLDAAEALIAVADRYLRRLGELDLADPAGAVVQASLLLRDQEVLAIERARFDEVLIDDFQLATFATSRLLTQLVGQGGAVTVAGNPEAAVADDVLASVVHLERFGRRMAAATIALPDQHRRPLDPPELHLVDGPDSLARLAADAVSSARTLGRRSVIVERATVASVVGTEVHTAVVRDATDGVWPSPPPTLPWFDVEVFHGPDVPDEIERARRWRALEHRRFRVATSRATGRTIVLARTPVTPFLADLIDRPSAGAD